VLVPRADPGARLPHPAPASPSPSSGQCHALALRSPLSDNCSLTAAVVHCRACGCIVSAGPPLLATTCLQYSAGTLKSAVFSAVAPLSHAASFHTGQTRHSLARPRLAACCQARLLYITLTTHARDELRPAVTLNRICPASTAFVPPRREGEPRPADTPPFACLARVALSEQ
jgi:hypothetical protein